MHVAAVAACAAIIRLSHSADAQDLSRCRDIAFGSSVASVTAATCRLCGVSRRLEAAARVADTEAARLDTLEAPQREAAQAVAEAERQTAAAEKTRTTDKSHCRP